MATPLPDRRLAERRVVLGRRLGDPSAADVVSLVAAILDRERSLVRPPLSGDSFLKPGWAEA